MRRSSPASQAGRTPWRAGTALALVAVLALAGCSSGSDSEDVASGEAVAGGSVASGSDGGATADREAAPTESKDGAQAAGPRALVISTGTVSLRADDVAEARSEVQEVVDLAGGEVTDEETRTGRNGDVASSRLVVRVPSDRFAETMDELEGVAELEASTTTSEDVTTQVIDLRVRIRVQRASIARIEALLGRARTIRDIVAIEAQLTRRQAALNSLLRRNAYLTDQTSLSTITVLVDRERDRPVEEDEDGFLAGLEKGWDALATFGVALLTVAGALLPWAVAFGVLLVPLLLALRLLRRRRDRAAGVAGGSDGPAGPTGPGGPGGPAAPVAPGQSPSATG